MGFSERDKMKAGEWYCCDDPELDRLRCTAREAVHAHNIAAPKDRGHVGAALATLMGGVPESTFLEAPFHCAYGINISLGSSVYLNAGCTILDTASVCIGEGTMLGPYVQIYCAEHHKNPEKRRMGLEIAKPVEIGADVWVGGGAIILGGITIGDGAIVGAGAVVTKNVACGTTVIGNPAKIYGITS